MEGELAILGAGLCFLMGTLIGRARNSGVIDAVSAMGSELRARGQDDTPEVQLLRDEFDSLRTVVARLQKENSATDGAAQAATEQRRDARLGLAEWARSETEPEWKRDREAAVAAYGEAWSRYLAALPEPEVSERPDWRERVVSFRVGKFRVGYTHQALAWFLALPRAEQRTWLDRSEIVRWTTTGQDLLAMEREHLEVQRRLVNDELDGLVRNDLAEAADCPPAIDATHITEFIRKGEAEILAADPESDTATLDAFGCLRGNYSYRFSDPQYDGKQIKRSLPLLGDPAGERRILRALHEKAKKDVLWRRKLESMPLP
jgi:hypothetical protein